MKRTCLLILGVIPFIANAKVAANGFYFDAGAGGSSINYYSGGSTAVGRIDAGYDFNRNVGIQIGFNDYFGATTSNSSGSVGVSGYGYDVSILPSYSFGKNNAFSMFGRLGFGSDDLTSSFTNQTSFIDVIGGGLRYDLSAHLSTSIQWIGRGDLTNSGDASYSQNSVIASVGFYF